MNAIDTLLRDPIHLGLTQWLGRLTRDATAEPVSRDQILRHERGQGNIHFPCSVDHEQDWQPYPVDPYQSCYICDHTYIPLQLTAAHYTYFDTKYYVELRFK